MGQLSSIDISSSCTLFLLLVCEIEFRFFYVVGELLLLAKEASSWSVCGWTLDWELAATGLDFNETVLNTNASNEQSPRRYLCQRSLNLSKIYPNDNMLATIYPSVTNFIDIFPLSLKCSTEAWFSKLKFHPIFKMGRIFLDPLTSRRVG